MATDRLIVVGYDLTKKTFTQIPAAVVATVILGPGAGAGATLDATPPIYNVGGNVGFTAGIAPAVDVLFTITFGTPGYITKDIFASFAPGDDATSTAGLIQALFVNHALMLDNTQLVVSVTSATPILTGNHYSIDFLVRGK